MTKINEIIYIYDNTKENIDNIIKKIYLEIIERELNNLDK